MNRRNFVFHLNFFLMGLAGLSLLAWLFNTIPPEQGSVVILGIIILVGTIFSILYSLSNNVRRSLLLSGGIGILLSLRALKLYDPLYVILLLSILISLEYALRKH